MRIAHSITRLPDTPNRSRAIHAQVIQERPDGTTFIRYDFTNERAVIFPEIWTQLREDQQDALLAVLAPHLIEILIQ